MSEGIRTDYRKKGVPWSLTRVHFLHTVKMIDALEDGWEPFASVGDFVLLRRLSNCGPTVDRFHVTYTEWKPE